MALIRNVIVAYIVLVVLDLLTMRSEKKSKRRSQKRFVVKAPSSMMWLGIVGLSVLVAIFVGAEFTGESGLYMNVMASIGSIPCLMAMVAPIKGLWDVRVDGDDITIVKLFIFRKSFKFSKITRMKQRRGGFKVYVEGRTRMAFYLDAMNEGVDLFMKRAEKEGIDIEEFEEKSRYVFEDENEGEEEE